jgi:cysteine-rich repeat protein
MCGDGIVVLGEQCDDGINDGGYGECGEGCIIGPYCGDSVVDSEYEDCDDGNQIDGDGCASDCQDRIVQ